MAGSTQADNPGLTDAVKHGGSWLCGLTTLTTEETLLCRQ